MSNGHFPRGKRASQTFPAHCSEHCGWDSPTNTGLFWTVSHWPALTLAESALVTLCPLHVSSLLPSEADLLTPIPTSSHVLHWPQIHRCIHHRICECLLNLCPVLYPTSQKLCYSCGLDWKCYCGCRLVLCPGWSQHWARQEWTEAVWTVFSTQHWSHCGGVQHVFECPGAGTRNVLPVKLVGSETHKWQPKTVTRLGETEQTLERASQPSGMPHHLAVVTSSPLACPSFTTGKVTTTSSYQI